MFPPTDGKCTFLLVAIGTFSETDDIIGQKANLNNNHNEILLVSYQSMVE